MAVKQGDPLSHLQTELQNDANIPEPSPSPSTSSSRQLSDEDDVDDRFPLFNKYRLEHSITSELKAIFESEAFCDLQTFCDKLVPITRVVVDREAEAKERPPFHYKVSLMTIRHFIDKHQSLHEEGHQNVFDILFQASLEPSDDELVLVPYALANLFVLAGPLLFARPKALKLLDRAFNSIPNLRSDKLDKIKFLTSRCLVWSFSRIVDWGVIASSLWSQALQVLTSHLSMDDMPPLVSLAISSHCPAESSGSEFQGARLAAVLVYDLITRRKDESFRSLGFKLLQQLLFFGPEGLPAVSNEAFTLGNFSKIDSIINDVEYIPHEGPQSRAIRWDLTTDEIESAWDFLASAWHQFIREEVQRACQSLQPEDTIELTYETTEMWRMLLHTSGKDKSAVEPICDAHVKIVLNPPKLENRTSVPLLHSIQATKQLWLVTMNELKFSLRGDVAEMILRKLLERRDFYEGFKGRAMVAWFNLIEELVYCDPHRALLAISVVRVRSDDRILMQQRIWCDMMHFIVVADVRQRGIKTYFSISELVEFLKYPYTLRFDMSDEYVCLLWDTLLERALNIAQERRKSALVLNLMVSIEESKRSTLVRRLIAKSSRLFGVDVEEAGAIARVAEAENFVELNDRTRRSSFRFGQRGRQF